MLPPLPLLTGPRNADFLVRHRPAGRRPRRRLVRRGRRRSGAAGPGRPPRTEDAAPAQRRLRPPGPDAGPADLAGRRHQPLPGDGRAARARGRHRSTSPSSRSVAGAPGSRADTWTRSRRRARAPSSVRRRACPYHWGTFYVPSQAQHPARLDGPAGSRLRPSRWPSTHPTARPRVLRPAGPPPGRPSTGGRHESTPRCGSGSGTWSGLVVVWVISAFALEVTAWVLPNLSAPTFWAWLAATAIAAVAGPVRPPGAGGDLRPDRLGHGDPDRPVRAGAHPLPVVPLVTRHRVDVLSAFIAAWVVALVSLVLSLRAHRRQRRRLRRQARPAAQAGEDRRPRGRRRHLRPAGRRPLPGAALGARSPARCRPSGAGSPSGDYVLHEWTPQLPCTTPGQPAGHPARHDRPDPGVPLVRPRARPRPGRQPARRRRGHRGAGQRRPRAARRRRACRSPTSSPATPRGR